MPCKIFHKLFLIGILLVSNLTFAGNVSILNQNFESDVVPSIPGHTSSIAGWVNSGTGGIGVLVPAANGIHYSSISDKEQVAFLDAAGRISQTTKVPIVEGETYTLTFDHGWRSDQLAQHFVVRLKANGFVLAQKHSENFSTTKGNWSTESLTLIADSTMPLYMPLVVEFQNLSVVPELQANIDNIQLNISGTGVVQLPQNSLEGIALITEDTILQVPETFMDIHAALNHLDNKRIQAGSKVTIAVSDCSNQSYSQSININHPNAQAIHIVGDVNAPESCTLQFNGSSGIVVADGNQLGSINGFTIQGDLTPSTIGLHASNAGVLNTGINLVISSFERGIVAEHDASVIANNVIVENNTDIGVYSYSGGYVAANSAISRSNGAGFVAEGASVIEASHAEAYTNTGNGFVSLYNSTLIANNSASQSNLDNGYFSKGRSVIEAKDSVANNNTNKGYFATDASFQDIKNSLASGNGSSYSPNVNTTTQNFYSMLKR